MTFLTYYHCRSYEHWVAWYIREFLKARPFLSQKCNQ